MTRVFRRAVVTGGAGFVGALVCRRLLAAGTAVVCVDNLRTRGGELVKRLHSWPGFEFRNCDVTLPFDVPGEVDLVLHLASPAPPAAHGSFPIQTLDAGSLGARNALNIAERTHARFVLASTSEVGDDQEQAPRPDTYWGYVNPVGSRSAYDEAKRFAEAMTAAYASTGHVDAAIARIFNSYGPGMRADDGGIVPTFARQALRGEPLTVTGDGSQTRSLCHVSDTVRGLLLLASSELAGPVNIGNPEEVTVRQIAATTIARTNSSSRIRYVPGPEHYSKSSGPDISLARSALGFEPRVSWQQGLPETLDWFARVARPAPLATVATSGS